MFGFACCCATAGMTVAITATAHANRPTQLLCLVLMIQPPLLDVDEDLLVWRKSVDGLCNFGRKQCFSRHGAQGFDRDVLRTMIDGSAEASSFDWRQKAD
jgi:hypothetical protein